MGLRRRRRSSASSSDGLIDPLDRNGLFSPIKVYYARKKKPESRLSITIQVISIVACFALAYYVYYHFDHFHFHLVHFYAHHMDDAHAQHTLGHKLLAKGDNHSAAAFHWFRKSAAKGHPHSAYNLAAGHLSGFPTDLQKGEAKKLLEFAAKHDVIEAHQLLHDLCYDKPDFCDH